MNNHKINSRALNHPLMGSLLAELVPIFDSLGLRYYIIGATARDIVMEIYGEAPGRRTKDIDFAIAVNNWGDFETLETSILSNSNFTKSQAKQQFIYLDEIEVDLVPYGKLAKNDKIFWPPDETIAMSILGFKEAEKSLITTEIDGLEIEVASLASIFLLKLIAWNDRYLGGNKDADDLGFVLQNYLPVNEERAATKYYDEVYEIENFSIIKGGAALLGIDVSGLIGENDHVKNVVKELVNNQVEEGLESPLFNQIIETNSISFDEVMAALIIFNKTLN